MNAVSVQPLPDQLDIAVKVLFTDVDDTLTWQGQLPLETFQAMSRLQQAGIQVIPVTGACGGWCDCMIRTWPVTTVIGENGSFWMAQDSQGHVQTSFRYPEEVRAKNRTTLLRLGQQLSEHFPDVGYTLDQQYRLTDMAFDIGQQAEVPTETAIKATQWLTDQGISARLSSIHINAWLGDYSKADTALHWLQQQSDLHPGQCAFIGDSPNDEAMFEHFDHTFGVGNIRRFLPDLKYSPRFITASPGGYGFAELAEVLLNSQAT